MKNKILILFSLCILIFPFASADVLTPGFHGISVSNQIENINDFPDYVFVSGGSIGTGMCPLQIINNTGRIGSYYKFCSVFVYAIPKSKFNETKIEDMNSEKGEMSTEEVKTYLISIGGKEVIENINTYREVADVSPIKAENNYYTISLSQVKTEPDRVDIPKKNLIYIYIIVPIVAILIIIFILIKRKRK
jgi:hypothetical protein